MNLLNPILQAIPKRIYLVFLPGNYRQLRSQYLHFSMEKDYYWNHPTHLGLDLLYLQKTKSDGLVHFLTIEEVNILLRLWGLSDVAIPAIHTALEYLPNFHPRNIFVSSDESSTQNVLLVGPRDRYEAEYRLCRELSYFYLLIGEEDKSNNFFSRAKGAIKRTKFMSDEERAIANIYLLSDTIQAAREEGNFSDAIIALKEQKRLCNLMSFPLAQKHLSVIFNNLGILYREIGNFTASLESLKTSINYAKNLDYVVENLHTSIEIARTYISMNKYDEAINSLNQALDLTQIASPQDLYNEGIILGYLGLCYLNVGQLDFASESTSKALNIFKLVGAISDEIQAEQLQGLIDNARNP